MKYPSIFSHSSLLLALAALGDCTTTTTARSPRPPRSIVQPAIAPSYSGDLVQSFDDRIDRTSFDSGQAVPAALDPLLRERAEAADWILRGRIAAVTREQLGDTDTLRLTFVPEGAPVAGPRPPYPALELTVEQDNPFYRVLDGKTDRLLARRFLTYVKRFSTPGGEQLHWYMASESPEARAVIQEMHVLREVRAANP